jgi:hypothetical protein
MGTTGEIGDYNRPTKFVGKPKPRGDAAGMGAMAGRGFAVFPGGINIGSSSQKSLPNPYPDNQCYKYYTYSNHFLSDLHLIADLTQ